MRENSVGQYLTSFMITFVTWKHIVKVSYRQNNTMVKTTLLVRHINREHLHNLVCHHSGVIHELISFILARMTSRDLVDKPSKSCGTQEAKAGSSG
jgi:hypothetical protein